jgi:cyanate lyase
MIIMSLQVEKYLKVKQELGLSFDDIAGELGVTNVYAAQLFHGQVQHHAIRVHRRLGV